MKNVTLPIKTKVYSSSFLAHAFPLSIIQAQPDFHDTWICDKMINFAYHSNHLNKFMIYNPDWHFCACGAMKEFDLFIPKDSTKTFDFVKFVRENLRSGFYVSGVLNEKYIPENSAYGKFDMMHDFLIYGDDSDKQSFKFVGYNQDQLYTNYEVPYQCFINALYNVSGQGIQIFLFRPQDLLSLPDVSIILRGLSDYYYSKDSIRNDETGIFGRNAIEKLADYMTNCSNGDEYFDQRYIRSYFEHKKMMAVRMKYLADMKIIDNSTAMNYISIAKNVEAIHYLTMKYNMTRKKGTSLRIIDLLLISQEEESRLFNQIQDVFYR